MGEAIFYLRGEFDTKKNAVGTMTKLRPLLKDLVKLNDIWQENRGKKSAKEQIAELSKFPSWIFVPKVEIKEDDDQTNFLAGPLPDINNDFELEVVGDEIRLSCEVWHFTHWDGITSWLKKQDGCITAKYLSDEYLDPWAALSMKA